jgi:hypothetical protein
VVQTIQPQFALKCSRASLKLLRQLSQRQSHAQLRVFVGRASVEQCSNGYNYISFNAEATGHVMAAAYASTDEHI